MLCMLRWVVLVLGPAGWFQNCAARCASVAISYTRVKHTSSYYSTSNNERQQMTERTHGVRLYKELAANLQLQRPARGILRAAGSTTTTLAPLGLASCCSLLFNETVDCCCCYSNCRCW